MNILFSAESTISVKRKRVMIRELVQGQEAATQLKLRLQNPFGADGSLSVEELVANVLRSFTETLSVLMTPSDDEHPLGGDEVARRDLLSSGENGSPVVASGNYTPKSEDCSKSRKRSLQAKKDRRGCYKRKTAQTWTTVSHTTHDNHAWRKYGQKKILDSRFPRNYFKCSRKYEGCLATKQVQLIQQNPDMYQITYIGIHTCKATPKAQQYLVTDTSTWESYLLNSNPDDDSKVSNEQVHPISLPSLTTIKQEYPKEHTPSDVTDHKYMDFGVDSDYFRSTDFHFDGKRRFYEK